MQALTCEQVRRVDEIAIRDYQMPGIVLMENAGRGAAEIIHSLCPDATALVLCGRGNNGGDGYVIARHLQILGHEVSILAVCAVDELSGDAKVNAVIADAAGIEIEVIEEKANQEGTSLAMKLGKTNCIIDGLLGTGAKPPLRGIYAALVSAANESDAMRIALDIPTGLDGDTGEVIGEAFRADHTMTFVAPKVGFQQKNADEFVGVVHVVGIGVPTKLIRELDLPNNELGLPKN
ncbi:Bifunctional NAD(P)H-hydrate repair enzyme Nnr [Rubripirellula amarantea]|uniref:NAD(P)H-hydrate epimerase n=1 Tax=Rubripirellula amarantea TaxID=2527999 RepID=A0A5C5WXA9_9BACT|nr:NAD(P)H-hydrate epimerase [Rubripirellula amarantea]TWT54525.1 Bifunctional NAD(P)H-hydrate repair enzyme Nnr [Rubripirellula amarantea]